MNCLYYLAPTLDSTHRISDDLHAAGIDDFYLHVVSKDESGLKNEHLHSSNYLETHDIVRDGLIGAASRRRHRVRIPERVAPRDGSGVVVDQTQAWAHRL